MNGGGMTSPRDDDQEKTSQQIVMEFDGTFFLIQSTLSNNEFGKRTNASSVTLIVCLAIKFDM